MPPSFLLLFTSMLSRGVPPAAAAYSACVQAGHIPSAAFVDWTADIVRDTPHPHAPGSPDAKPDFVPVRTPQAAGQRGAGAVRGGFRVNSEHRDGGAGRVERAGWSGPGGAGRVVQ